MVTLAQQIRDFVDRRYITPAKRQNHATVTVSVGVVHREMNLQSRVPAVVAALESKIFERQCGVRVVGRSGPKQSTSVQITYALHQESVGEKIKETSLVNADTLNVWRRQLVRWLSEIDRHPIDTEGVVSKIKRLSAVQGIDKETAALMISLVEMRNSTEYRFKQLSPAESGAVTHAWLAIVEWAKARGFKPAP